MKEALSCRPFLKFIIDGIYYIYIQKSPDFKIRAFLYVYVINAVNNEF